MLPVTPPGTRECPSCALDAPAEAPECPFCGYEFPPEPPARRATAWLFVLLMLLVALPLLAWLFG